jgi:truncated hemoglobin YjbI
MGTQMSLFDRLGGAPAISAAAELFYRQGLADPLLARYFDDGG